MNLREQRLLDGLIGDHGRLFYENPEFHATITALARIIPDVIDVIAKRSEEAASVREETLSSLVGPDTWITE